MQHHIIFTNGRSGSNYLAGVINQHPQLVNYGEVLGEWTVPYRLYEKLTKRQVSIDNYLDYIYSSKLFFYLAQFYSSVAHLKKSKKINFKRWPFVKSLGIKDFSMNFTRKGIRNYLSQRPDIKVICLYRENHLQRYLSYLNLQQSGVVSIEKSSVKSQPRQKFQINIPIETCLQELEKIEKETNEQLEIVAELSPHNVYNIRYEDLFSSQEKKMSILNGMFTFLSVEGLDLKEPSKKILTQPMSDTIDNYEDFYLTLKGTNYERFLDDTIEK